MIGCGQLQRDQTGRSLTYDILIFSVEGNFEKNI